MLAKLGLEWLLCAVCRSKSKNFERQLTRKLIFRFHHSKAAMWSCIVSVDCFIKAGCGSTNDGFECLLGCYVGVKEYRSQYDSDTNLALSCATCQYVAILVYRAQFTNLLVDANR